MKRGLVGIARDLAALLHQEAPVGPRVRQLLVQRLLGALVGHRLTKSAGPLRLTCSCWTSLKSRRSRGAALRAARSMTVIRPEWEGISYSLPSPSGEGSGEGAVDGASRAPSRELALAQPPSR